jgi:hypothetical protein
MVAMFRQPAILRNLICRLATRLKRDSGRTPPACDGLNLAFAQG